MNEQNQWRLTPEDTLVVSDLDRTLLNTPGAQDLFVQTVGAVAGLDPLIIQDAREAEEATGGSFDTLGFVKQHVDNPQKMQDIEWIFRDTARSIAGEYLLREDGAKEYLATLGELGLQHCIMTYGQHDWQKLKLQAAGLDDIPYRIVDTKDKARRLATTFDKTLGLYVVRIHETEFRARHILLVDDKASAFAGAPQSIRGIHLLPHLGEMLPSQGGVLPHDGIVPIRGLRRATQFIRSRAA